MCGICGIVAPPGAVAPVEIVQRMVRALAHRGPDEQATHTAGRVAVGHTRLSIIDLAASKQPMVDDQRGMVLVFNGEIYNYKELREELRASGHVFTTAGDTEVVLRAYQVFGADCVTRLQGMFAFVIVSEEGRRIFAARDRLGIKPLFYALGDDGRFSFASELSALFEDASLSRVMDREAFAYFFTFGYCPDPLTLVAAARQLPPAHVLSIRDGRGAMRRYWSFVIGGRGGGRRRGEATARFRDLVEEAVRAHLVADVPVGSFLSSGLDSSLVTTLAARAAGQPIRTFTVGVRSEEGDERPFARVVAEACGSDHRELMVHAGAFERVWVDRLVRAFGQPFFDTSAIPTYVLCEAVSRHVKVALSGDGGDELFAGYQGHSRLLALYRLRGLPRNLLSALAGGAWRLEQRVPALRRLRVGFDLASRDPADMVIAHRSMFAAEDLTRLFPGELGACFRPGSDRTRFDRMREVMEPARPHGLLAMTLQLDTEVTLPADILTKVDRMSMAHGLEVRPPLLDHRLVEFAAGLPDAFKIRGKRRKILLRALGREILPPVVLTRPKRGFSIHLRGWLNADFFALARALTREAEDVDRPWLLRWIDACESATGDIYPGRSRGALSLRLWMIVLFLRWRAELGIALP